MFFRIALMYFRLLATEDFKSTPHTPHKGESWSNNLSTPKNYVWNPTDYAKNSANQYTWAQELIPKLKLKGDETLLDIGCGDGKITANLAKYLQNGKVVGIDSSSQMIKLAKTTFPNEQYPNLTFQVMDAQNLTFQEEFDLAFSNAALHWITNQKPVLLGVQRSLKPQGRLLFQMAGKGNAQAIIEILDELLVLSEWKRFFEDFKFPYAFCAPEEYRALLVEAGLEPLRVERFPKDMKFNGAEGIAGWVRTTWLPFTERIPIERQNDFIKQIVNRYLEKFPADAQGVVHLGMIRLEVEAVKLCDRV
jgi:trans-aconitate 2-methyltransferase